MKVIDAHVHLRDNTTPSDVEAFIEGTNIAEACVISRICAGAGEKVREYVEELADLHAKAGDVIHPFALIDPTYEKAPEVLEWAVRDCGIVGLKLLPENFHIRDERARALYGLAGELGIPILIHTGILWRPGDNADFCRPGHMEVMWDYPQTRFAMAHISWPWTDECIAVAQKFKMMRPEIEQAFVDITPGTPQSYRKDALAKCIENVGIERMLYGSDSSLPTGWRTGGHWPSDQALLDELDVSRVDQEKLFYYNARRFVARSGASGHPFPSQDPE